MTGAHGKRYTELAKKVERGHEYSPVEGVKLVKETSRAKFDTTVELHLRMGVDPKHADQMVRGAAVLPHGTGKSVRVIVFAQGDKAREAQTAGADAVGAASFSEQALVENLGTVMEAINRARPPGVKGNYVRSAHLTSTQGPSVKVDLGATLALSGRGPA